MEENNETAVEAAAEENSEMVVETAAVGETEVVVESAMQEETEAVVETASEEDSETVLETILEDQAETIGENTIDEDVEVSVASVETSKPESIEELSPKMMLEGTVAQLELYGAFIDIGVGTNALIHISKLAKDHVNRVSDVLQVGDVVKVWVEKINPEQGQIMVTMLEPLAVDWSDLKKGQSYTGTITRIENYGAFVDIGAEREGLVHISEISHDYVKNPTEVLNVGDEVQVQVLDFNRRKRRIDLSIKNLQEKPQAEGANTFVAEVEVTDDVEEEFEEVPTAMEIALRRAMGDEPMDELDEQDRRSRRKGRNKQRRRETLDDLLDRTLHYPAR